MKARIKVTVSPKATKTRVAGTYADSIKIQVAAAPERGKANAELTAFVAKKLGVPKSDVNLKSGASSKSKIIEIKGMSTRRVAEILLGPEK